MKIGIDISQLAYKDTGVANYLEHLVEQLLKLDQTNEYVLFFSSMRGKFPISNFKFPLSNKNVTLKLFRFPPSFLDLLWNRLHIFPIENFIGDVDIFISSDWTQPPVKNEKSVTILYDLIVYKFPDEMDRGIIETQKRKLHWVKKECDLLLCISEATKKDAMEILKIDPTKLRVVYPGMTL
jgi:hypothetical protein